MLPKIESYRKQFNAEDWHKAAHAGGGPYKVERVNQKFPIFIVIDERGYNIASTATGAVWFHDAACAQIVADKFNGGS